MMLHTKSGSRSANARFSPLGAALVLSALGLGLCGCGEEPAPKQRPVLDAPPESPAQSSGFSKRTAKPGAAAATSLSSADWGQWRGPRRDGKSLETGLAQALPPAGPTQLWSREIGIGFSGMALAAGGLFTAFIEDDSSFIARLNPADGKELWRHSMGKAFGEAYGDGPRATPTVDGERVFMMTSRAKVVAVDVATGMELWSCDLGQELKPKKLEFRGYSSSPLVAGEFVVVQFGPTDGHSLVAINKTTGTIAWKSLDGRSAFSSPLAATLLGKQQIISTLGSGIAGVDALSGEKLWSFDWETNFKVSVATPIQIDQERVFLSVGYDKGAVMLKLSQAGGTWQVEEEWSNAKFRNHYSSSVASDDFLYGFDNSMLKCIRQSDGEEQWKHRGFGKGTLMLADGLLIVLGETGLLSLAEATPDGFEELGSVQVFEGKCWTPPSLSNGRLYLRSTNRIVCLDLRSRRSATAGE